MPRSKITILAALSAVSAFPLMLGLAPLARGDANPEAPIKGATMRGERGITETVEQIMER